MDGTNLSRLRSLQHERPNKLINVIRLAWPQIRAALERGHTLRRIHERLLEDGIRISYGLFTVYVKRLLAGQQKTVSPPQDGERDRQLQNRTPPLHDREQHGLEHSGFFREGVPDFARLIGGDVLNESRAHGQEKDGFFS
jgi:hypothetical protein